MSSRPSAKHGISSSECAHPVYVSALNVVAAPTAHIAAWSNTHKMHEAKHTIKTYQTCIDIAAVATMNCTCNCLDALPHAC